MTVRGAAFLDVGSTVDTRILALLGEAGTVASSAVLRPFLIAGVAAYHRDKPGQSWARYPSSQDSHITA
ncbi:hypothetical protein JOF56_004973 [Kibdelosporangium banguiense]|uniref:Uncharacterized protein n=1 Tax=Kibdelosporangium banguiense TaxID=1365924 RepID=A0ABS4TJJ4_9PSEU|nr:hypothetical protein [Kibdelosporangium banguiense]